MERRNGPIDPAYMVIITSMLYSILSPESKKFVTSEGAKSDFTLMRKAITKLRTMEVAARPVKMDIGSLQEVQFDGYTESEWVLWQDAGRPEYEDEDENDPGSLAALQRKGKGKGKGRKGVKGEGKGRGG